MPLAGNGMLITSIDVDEEDEQEFNIRYDREHLAERVAIDGFLEARRWIAVDATPKYFCTCTTRAFDDLGGRACQRALANQTDGSGKNIARNMMRAAGRVTASRGQGRGAALAVVRLRPASGSEEQLRAQLRELMDPGTLPGIISLHLVESDAQLSKLLAGPGQPDAGAGDWFLLVEGTDVLAVLALAQLRFVRTGARVISVETWRLLWDLAKSDLRPDGDSGMNSPGTAPPGSRAGRSWAPRSWWRSPR